MTLADEDTTGMPTEGVIRVILGNVANQWQNKQIMQVAPHVMQVAPPSGQTCVLLFKWLTLQLLR